MPIDGRVTHAQRTGDINHRRLIGTEPANDFLCRGQNASERERFIN
jgi:hypothetical protein